MELTLLELNLEEPSFRANAPFAGRERNEEESGTDIDVSSGESDGSSGPPAKAFIVGLLFLVGVGLAVRRFMGSDSSTAEDEVTADPITA